MYLIYGKPLKNLKCKNLNAIYTVVANTKYRPTNVSKVSTVLRVVPNMSPKRFTTVPTLFGGDLAAEYFFKLAPMNRAGKPNKASM